ncbi:putative gustatory receptor 98b [Drosophila virilis]|uniref:Gustatory receptor n=1 Tax=Drosophila virilis TaxID=7244 RepID=B4M029_DROVI|nr:putative gustatory receptor 98b [Drosophila virilis]EDW68279.1 uncharacterized protein Dvir_GJ24626 [Drosophila virilis]
MEGQLLATARPYLQFFSLVTLIPPPSSYARDSDLCRRRLLIFAFGCYSCCVLLLGMYVTYVNIITLNFEIRILEVEDFTSALGIVQKIFYTILLAIIHVNMLICFRRLGHIYMNIAALELDLDDASLSFGGLVKRTRFRQRLAHVIGLWIMFLLLAFPIITVPVMTEYMSWRNKILTEFLLLVLQLKGVEYVLFVVIVQELLLRLRHTLIYLQQELADCNQRVLLQALCLALLRNKQLMARVWKLVGELEAYYLLPMLCLFLYNGLAMLHIVNWAYIQAFNPSDCANCRYLRVGNLMLLFINLLIPCWLSQNCIGTYNSFKRIIHNIRYGKINPPLLSNALREYALQLEHLKLRFTCGNFFEINLKCFGSMVVTIVSFTIILIQFKLQGIVDAKRQIKQKSQPKAH